MLCESSGECSDADWEPLYVEESVGDHSEPACANTAAPPVWPSGCAALHSPLGCRADSELTAMEEPVGSSHLVPVIIPPVCPCLYLTVQQKIPMSIFSAGHYK